jgi:hypothetical protein
VSSGRLEMAVLYVQAEEFAKLFVPSHWIVDVVFERCDAGPEPYRATAVIEPRGAHGINLLQLPRGWNPEGPIRRKP